MSQAQIILIQIQAFVREQIPIVLFIIWCVVFFLTSISFLSIFHLEDRWEGDRLTYIAAMVFFVLVVLVLAYSLQQVLTYFVAWNIVG
jgi:hypothetical protein